jgi:hypothetical protein
MQKNNKIDFIKKEYREICIESGECYILDDEDEKINTSILSRPFISITSTTSLKDDNCIHKFNNINMDNKVKMMCDKAVNTEITQIVPGHVKLSESKKNKCPSIFKCDSLSMCSIQ